MGEIATAGPDAGRVPGRVEAAQAYLYFAAHQAEPAGPFDGHRPAPRELTPRERATYDAALEVLRLYFAGEMDYGDAPPRPAPGPPDDPPPHAPTPAGA